MKCPNSNKIALSKPCTKLVSSSIWALFLVMAVVAGCTGSKSLAKKAAQLEEAGLYDDAAMFYYNSLLRNDNNIDARIGLTKTSQKVINDKTEAFTKARTFGDARTAVYKYADLKAYCDKLNGVGIKTDLPPYLDEDYAEVKKTYLKDLYEEGNELMAQKNFDRAHAVFSEIERLEPGYKDIAALKNTSANEPLYVAATTDFDGGRYRSAYYTFEEIFKTDPNYKEVAVLREECLNLGRYPVAVMPFENASRDRGAETRMNAFVLTQLAAINDPFLKIVERENLDLILKEQRLNMTGIVDGSTAAEAGNLLGAKAIITGSLLSFSTSPGQLRSTTKKGYESYTVKKYDKENERNYFETKYKPVHYTEYSNQNSVSISFQYKAISLETGEVLFSQVVDRKLIDKIDYAVYSGEITRLYPANKDGVELGRGEKNQLIQLLRADRHLKSVDDLSNEAYFFAARELTEDLQKHLRTL